jgi:hypothetical protein
MTFQAALKKPQTFGRLVAILVSNSILWFVMTIAATLRKTIEKYPEFLFITI